MNILKKYFGNWRTVLFVCSLMSIAHHHIPGFDALDNFAFLPIGSLAASLSQDWDTKKPNTVAILIDQETFKNEYAERSPLDRCVLRAHLEKIYSAEPALLVIDLDISPVIQLPENHKNEKLRDELKRQFACEEELYKVIASNGKKTITVLLAPFSIEPGISDTSKKPEDCSGTFKSAKCWQWDMQCSGIYFGLADIHEKFGFVNNSYKDRPTLSRCAYYQQNIDSATNSCVSKDIINQPSESDNFFLIQPSHYIKIESIDLQDINLSKKLKSNTAVFFGADYGFADRFITPVGELSGVIIHAASYLSIHDKVRPFNKVLSFIIDLLIGFGFGIVINTFWGKYFRDRTRPSAAWKKQIAFLWILVLLIAFAISLIVASIVAVIMLFWLGLWLSPVPIGIGMFFDSFITGSVEHAEHLLEHEIHKTNEEAHNKINSTNYFPQVWRKPTTKELRGLLVKYTTRLEDFIQSFWRKFRKDVPTACCIGLRQLIWFGVVGYELSQIFFSNH